MATLRRQGYEPYHGDGGGDDPTDAVRLRNCPFDKLAAEHRELVCHANLALLEGVVDQLGVTALEPCSIPARGECCVAFRRARS
ncbi:MAG TPA: hypothetical protein VFA46_14730 [Actinomycetes bacterium]|jgi:predicted ArsR family transcriptional regulator|nr:hypothetical protein [Actinomycetes bacterium]